MDCLYERFWSKVDKRGPDECWLWKSTTNGWGYGVIRVGGTRSGGTMLAHRLSLAMAWGPLEPPEDKIVMHSCDTPLCVNPQHLNYGTDAENWADMRAKGRHARGERHGNRQRPEQFRHEKNGNAKLTWAQVDDIRRRYAAGGITKTALSKEYGVTDVNVCSIVNGNTWRGGRIYA